jgi:hypothetical protein
MSDPSSPFAEPRRALLDSLEDVQRRIDDHTRHIMTLEAERAGIRGRIEGLDLAATILAGTAAPEAPAKRRNLREEITRLLAQQPGQAALTIKQIAETLNIRPANAEALVDGLREASIVTVADGRVELVSQPTTLRLVDPGSSPTTSKV